MHSPVGVEIPSQRAPSAGGHICIFFYFICGWLLDQASLSVPETICTE